MFILRGLSRTLGYIMHRPNIEEQEKCAGLILIFYDIIETVNILH